MKRAVLVLGILLMGLSVASAHTPPQGGAAVSFGVFYSSLGPYGEWIALDNGVYAWRPLDVRMDWRPYTVGRWVWTADGWYWLSDEPWGWAAYHYGRWYYDDFYGWVWIPGYDWAPAWVEWRYGGDYVGWAPLGPYAIFSVNVGIVYRTRWVTPYSYWSFVQCRYISQPQVQRYVYRASNNTRYFGYTRSAGNIRYEGGRIVSRGPERSYVEQRGKIRVASMDIADTDQRVERVTRTQGHDRIEVYRPRIEARADAAERPGRVREGERKVNIDVGRMDDRLRRADQGREVDRVQPRRQEQDRWIESRPEMRREERKDRKPESADPVRIERRMETAPQQQDRSVRPDMRREQQVEQKSGSVQRKAVKPEDHAGRRPQMKENRRSANPERTIRRPEPRKEDKRSDDANPKREGRGR